MPRKGSAYPIDDEWRGRVRSRMVEMGISQNELGRRAGVSKASISDALSKESKQSTCVPEIHKALEWPAPAPMLLAPDAHEILALFDSLSERDKGEMLGRLREKAEQRQQEHPPDELASRRGKKPRKRS